ncbi:MAG: methylamine utilization protein MauG [Rhodobacterales bacterium]|nr:MAG: methylamine utilization protein MauG [Rhodobacterales bacterium]
MRPLILTLATVIASPLLADPYPRLETLGEALFFDENLSRNRTQSCSTCHDPDHGFVDPRETDVGRMASLGDDGVSFGDRNAPTVAYGVFSPRFGQDADGSYFGGMFHDGREPDLEGQAGGPPLNPIEMGMPDKASVVARIQENADYVQSFNTLFAKEILSDPERGYRAMTQAIAAFERTDLFAPFDSKYDRYLRGEVAFTREEELGRLLFFSEQFTNCNLCHQLRTSQMDQRETFTDYQYHNIGVPVNHKLRAVNGAKGTLDKGLAANPHVDPEGQMGKFKTPTLRNVAVTGPYMHNGVFQDLRTVVLFYNRYNSKAEARQINPETGKVFGNPEVPQTLAVKELTHGPALEDERIDALVAFMKTLTDKRYEHLLDE